jgi:hypothetical protein
LHKLNWAAPVRTALVQYVRWFKKGHFLYKFSQIIGLRRAKMDNNALSLLGCTSVLAFVIATGNAANAAPEKHKSVSSVASAKPTAVKTVNASSKNLMHRYISLDPMSDTVGDAAVAKFQCDCPPCCMAIVQMVQSGQMTL